MNKHFVLFDLDDEEEESKSYSTDNKNNESSKINNQIESNENSIHGTTIPDAAKKTPLTIWNLFDRAQSVIISIISSAVYSIVSQRGDRIENTILIIGVFLMWMILDGYIREWLGKFWSLQHNRGWQAVLLDTVNFISMLGIFLVLKVALEDVVGKFGQNSISIIELLVTIYSVLLIVLSLVQTIKMLSE